MPTTTIDSAQNAQTPAHAEARRIGKPTRWLRPIVHHLPTLAVMACLIAVGAYGHYSHWQVPKFSSIVGAAPPVVDDWCQEHSVPESQCVECNPGLLPSGPDYGWCQEHGVHNCTLHHPDVAQLEEPPVVSDADFVRAARALAFRERPRSNSACKVYQRRIQFASIEAVQQAGIDVELVERRAIREWVSGNGEIKYDATRFASLSSPVGGTVWRVLKNVGDPVQQGEILAVLDAMEVGRLKGILIKALVAEELARKNVDRLGSLSEGVVPGKRILEMEAALAQAEADVLGAEQALANLGLPADASKLRNHSKRAMLDRLRFLGFPPQLARQFESQTATSNLIPIRSPLDGVVVERQVVAGEVVDPTQTLFEVADPSRMWLILNVPLEHAGVLSVGQTVHFLPNGSEQEVAGTLSWISTAADKETRMVKVRADLDNPDGRLRDETFGAGRIILRAEPEAIVVPASAVHWEGCCQVVFVRNKDYFQPEAPKVFHVRSVRTGVTNAAVTEIIAGLLPGEVVVTEGSDVLRAQLLRNSLGEGCCAIE